MNTKLRELFNPRELIAALWPYRYSCFFFTHCNVRSKKWRALYAIIVTSCHFAWAHRLLNTINDYKTTDAFAGYTSLVAQWLMIPVNTIVWYFVGHACLMESVLSLTHIDRELVDICSKQVNFKAMVFRQLYHFVFSVFFYFLLTPIVDFQDSLSQITTVGARMSKLLLFYYTAMVNSLVISVFVDFVCAIGDRYALINFALENIRNDDNLKDEMKNRPDQRSVKRVLESIRRLRIIHRKLFTVSEKITKGFSVQVIICLVFIFFTMVHNFHRAYKIYTLYCHEMNATDIFIELYRFVTNVGITVELLHGCHRAVRETKRTASLLDSLINHSDDMYFEVSTFHHQLIHCEPQFSPFGFFRLNLSTLQSIAGAVTTYLVFLIQADPVFECSSHDQ